MTINRRRFLEFMGKGSALAALGGTNLFCSTQGVRQTSDSLSFLPLPVDYRGSDFVLAQGFQHQILLKWQDEINDRGDLFGSDADYIAYFPLSAGEGILWVNHESVDPALLTAWDFRSKRIAKDVQAEMKAVGGSLVHIREESSGWKLIKESNYNKRISGETTIPFHQATILGSKTAMGTLGNCAGGVTPWNTLITAEENYHLSYGEALYDKTGQRKVDYESAYMKWYETHNNPPEHYGWLVEVNPKTGEAKKHIQMGRFAHECGTCTRAKDGRAVVYSGDDKLDECLYKFISDSADNFDKGTLYAADLKKGEWLPLSVEKNPELKARFKTQTQLLIQTRDAAHALGATPLDRPEDVAIDPKNQNVFVTTTQNKPAGRPFGSILKIEEENADAGALRFNSEVFISGSPKDGFACPDNLTFDPQGNLWMTSDASTSDFDKPEFSPLGSNGLYYIPMSGERAGEVLRVASAPKGAELTGPCFSVDGKTLFLSVQHPEVSWPDAGGTPKSAVVAITGPALIALTHK